MRNKKQKKLEKLALLEKQDDVEIRADVEFSKILADVSEIEKLEKKAAIANPDFIPHAGAAAIIY